MDDALHNLKSIENILILANFADKILMPAKILLKMCIIYIGFEARPSCKLPCKKQISSYSSKVKVENSRGVFGTRILTTLLNIFCTPQSY